MHSPPLSLSCLALPCHDLYVCVFFQNLREQKETIKRANANLKETNEELSTSNKLLNRMSKWWRG